MINLMVDDSYQVTLLEIALEMAGLTYEVKRDDGSLGICPPFLIVDGVPLDMVRAMKWISSKVRKDNA